MGKIYDNMSELVKRTLSGAVFVAAVVASILWSSYAFHVLFTLFCVLAVDEYHRLVKSPRALRIYSFTATLLLCVTIQCMAWRIEGSEENFFVFGFCFSFGYLLLIVFALLDEIWNHSERPLESWGNLLISQVMIALPLATLEFLYFLDRYLLLALFVLIWINDTGAYCVGSSTAKLPKGNHKMTPHISPKKSWEGLAGGFIFTMVAALLLHYFGWFDAIASSETGVLVPCLFAFLVSAFGTMGDLMESLFKRSIGVKDSGKFLPGHGGVLDRFDSVLLAGPIITAFCWVCYLIAPLF